MGHHQLQQLLLKAAPVHPCLCHAVGIHKRHLRPRYRLQIYRTRQATRAQHMWRQAGAHGERHMGRFCVYLGSPAEPSHHESVRGGQPTTACSAHCVQCHTSCEGWVVSRECFCSTATMETHQKLSPMQSITLPTYHQPPFECGAPVTQCGPGIL
jgi:hypothetical protein